MYINFVCGQRDYKQSGQREGGRERGVEGGGGGGPLFRESCSTVGTYIRTYVCSVQISSNALWPKNSPCMPLTKWQVKLHDHMHDSARKKKTVSREQMYIYVCRWVPKVSTF